MKKPVAIEARQYTKDNAKEITDWCTGYIDASNNLIITTLEGPMRSYVGDWIIKGVRGEFYPCREEIFYETYEEVK
jgi:hypothetical protein